MRAGGGQAQAPGRAGRRRLGLLAVRRRRESGRDGLRRLRDALPADPWQSALEQTATRASRLLAGSRFQPLAQDAVGRVEVGVDVASSLFGECAADASDLVDDWVVGPVGFAARRLHGCSGMSVRGVVMTQVWAGPYCTELFALLGAEIIQIESRQRVDPTRGGSWDAPFPGTMAERPTARHP